MNGDVLRCGNVSGSGVCPPGFVCLQGVVENPNYGYTSFDTYGWAYLSTIRLFLKDYWEDLLYNLVKSSGPVQVVALLPIIILSYIFAAFIWAHFAVAYLAGIKRSDKSKEVNTLKKAQTKEIKNKFIKRNFLICLGTKGARKSGSAC